MNKAKHFSNQSEPSILTSAEIYIDNPQTAKTETLLKFLPMVQETLLNQSSNGSMPHRSVQTGFKPVKHQNLIVIDTAKSENKFMHQPYAIDLELESDVVTKLVKTGEVSDCRKSTLVDSA